MQLPTPKQRLSSPQTSDPLLPWGVVGWRALRNLRLAYWKWCSTLSFARAKPLDWLVVLLPQAHSLKKPRARVVAGGLARLVKNIELAGRATKERSTTKAGISPLTRPYSLTRRCYSLLKPLGGAHKHLPCWNRPILARFTLSTNLPDALSRSPVGLIEG